MYQRVISSGILVNLLLFSSLFMSSSHSRTFKRVAQKKIRGPWSILHFLHVARSKRDKRRTPYNQGNETDLIISVGNISDHSLPLPLFTHPFISPSAHHHRRDPSGTEVSRTCRYRWNVRFWWDCNIRDDPAKTRL